MANRIGLISFSLILIALGANCGRVASKNQIAPLIVAGISGLPESKLNSQPWGLMITNQPLMEGSALRTGPNSSVMMNSQVSPQRIALLENSELIVERWRIGSQRPRIGAEEVRLNLLRGMVGLDVPVLNVASDFWVQGSNFFAQVGSGSTVAAIISDGTVLVRSGTVVFVPVQPISKAVIVGAGQMVHPTTLVTRPIPIESNAVWNLLLP